MSERNPNARPINKALTKEMLIEMGIKSIVWNEEENQWNIFREWYKCGRPKEKIIKRIKITTSIRYHKYTNDTIYQTICFYVKNKPIQISLQRLLYCWFKGDIPDGYIIDHINDNVLDNRIENLQLLTPSQNQAKRYLNPENCKNQYDYCKKHGIELY